MPPIPQKIKSLSLTLVLLKVTQYDITKLSSASGKFSEIHAEAKINVYRIRLWLQNFDASTDLIGAKNKIKYLSGQIDRLQQILANISTFILTYV